LCPGFASSKPAEANPILADEPLGSSITSRSVKTIGSQRSTF
jgi:hypothetical protein